MSFSLLKALLAGDGVIDASFSDLKMSLFKDQFQGSWMQLPSGDNGGFKYVHTDREELKQGSPSLFVDIKQVCDCDLCSSTGLSIMRNGSLTCMHLGEVHVNVTSQESTGKCELFYSSSIFQFCLLKACILESAVLTKCVYTIDWSGVKSVANAKVP